MENRPSKEVLLRYLNTAKKMVKMKTTDYICNGFSMEYFFSVKRKCGSFQEYTSVIDWFRSQREKAIEFGALEEVTDETHSWWLYGEESRKKRIEFLDHLIDEVNNNY